MRVFAQTRLQSFAWVALSAALLCLPLSVCYGQSQPPVQSDSLSNISDEKLYAAAAALSRVTGISNIYAQRLAEAKNSSDKVEIAKEADESMAKAITNEGLSLTEYDSIIEVAQNDPKVREELLERAVSSRRK